MAEAVRVTPDVVRPKLQSGALLLVCAYDDEEKFKQMKLEGAISLSAFETKLPSLQKSQEIVFYCA
jgi:hypothetical protein